MNIQQLRQSLKMKWLNYYQENRAWLGKMRIWATYEGLRRPSSGFILATLSVLEPQFDQILAFILDLNNNPDQIIAALGLNFNPDEELSLISSEDSLTETEVTDDFPTLTQLDHEPGSSVVVDTKVNREIIPHLLYHEQPAEDFAQGEKVVSSVGVGTAELCDCAPRSAIGNRPTMRSATIATQPHREFLNKMLLVDKPRDDLPAPQPTVRSHIRWLDSLTSLARPHEVKRQTKTLPSLGASEVFSHSQTSSSLTLPIKIKSNGKPIKIKLKDLPDKFHPLPSTNARSLASWVDEFCQGLGTGD